MLSDGTFSCGHNLHRLEALSTSLVLESEYIGSFGTSPQGGSPARRVSNLRPNSRVQFVPLPESFMNQTDHKVKETANTQFT
jgi:hypothetical protein